MAIRTVAASGRRCNVSADQFLPVNDWDVDEYSFHAPVEVTDDKSLPKAERNRLQIEHAAHASPQAKLVKLADKICNLRDILASPPADWSVERKQEYFDWSAKVVAGVRDAHPGLALVFDQLLVRRPE